MSAEATNNAVMGLVGRKLGMTQLFLEDGRVIPVTVLEAGPCRVLGVKTQERDGYAAVQLAFEEIPDRKLNRPALGRFQKAGVPPARHLREFAYVGEPPAVGSVVDAAMFEAGQRIDVTGTSIGKGFAGGMKRHHFRGGPATHGSMFHRAPGSIGSSSWPSRVWKNKKLPGQMGNERVTVKRLEVVRVEPDQHLVFVRGAVPGARNGLVLMRKGGLSANRSGDAQR
ncbi:MAG: 50S ribosomal protein L3 [Nitrospirota bacterium]